ncbi:MAG: ribbon-helix-helix protein, CopG family [Nitrospirota bacterium]
MTTTIRLDPKTERRLAALSKSTGRTKSWYLREAIQDYLDEWEDYHIALGRLEKEKGEIDIKDVRRRLGLVR